MFANTGNFADAEGAAAEPRPDEVAVLRETFGLERVDVMDLPVDDKVYRIRFDDWMWQMNDGVLINRSYLKKFGFTVSELTIFMKKQKP